MYLLFVSLFPLIYISTSKANIYNGWRHELLFYSSFVLLVSIGWYEFWALIKSKVKDEKIIYPLAVAVMLGVISPTLIWMVKNHGYTYCYYNKAVGNPYLKYELDYLETSATKAYEWLRENELNKSDSMVTVSTKIFTPVYYAKMLHDTNHVKVFSTSYMGFAEADCDYSIINYHVIPPKAIKYFFPPKGTIHVEYVDGNPICAVVKRNKLDSRGIKLIREGKYQEGMNLLDSAYKYDPNNFGIWFWLGFGAYQNEQYEKTVKFMDMDMKIQQTGSESYPIRIMYKGAALAQLKKYDEAIPILKDAEKRAKDENLPFIKAQIGLAYYHKDNYKDAVPYLEACISNYPSLSGLLQKCKDLSKTQSSAQATANNNADTVSKQKVMDLFKL